MKKLNFYALLSLILVSVGCSHAPKEDAVGQALGSKSGYMIEGTFRRNGTFMPTTLQSTQKYAFAATDVHGVTMPNGLKKAQVTIMNRKDKTLNLQYRFFWYDESDMEIDPGSNVWQPIQLAGKVTRPIISTARRSDAYRFQVYIRELPEGRR